MEVYPCTKRGCSCGAPVVIRMIGGRRVALHLVDLICT